MDVVVTNCHKFKEDVCIKCRTPQIYAKTFKLEMHTVNDEICDAKDYYQAWLGVAKSAPVTQGYCERELNNMNSVSNHRICNNGVYKNIGYYYKISFSLKKPVTMQVHNPTDFGYGGVAAIDGETMEQSSDNIWAGGKSTKLDF